MAGPDKWSPPETVQNSAYASFQKRAAMVKAVAARPFFCGGWEGNREGREENANDREEKWCVARSQRDGRRNWRGLRADSEMIYSYNGNRVNEVVL